MKLREYIEQEYNKVKEEYKQNKLKLEQEYNKISKSIKEIANEYNILPYTLNECGKKIEDIWLRKYNASEKPCFVTNYYDVWEHEYILKINNYDYNNYYKKQLSLRSLLIRTKEILENKERYISIKKSELHGFSKYKNIELLDKISEYDSTSNINGELTGKLSGHKTFMFGSIGGSIAGELKGNSNSNYEDYLLIKYTYDLDLEVEDYMLDTMTLEQTINVLGSEV